MNGAWSTVMTLFRISSDSPQRRDNTRGNSTAAKSGTGFINHHQCAGNSRPDHGGQHQASQFSPRQRFGRAVQREIVESQVAHDIQPLRDIGPNEFRPLQLFQSSSWSFSSRNKCQNR